METLPPPMASLDTRLRTAKMLSLFCSQAEEEKQGRWAWQKVWMAFVMGKGTESLGCFLQAPRKISFQNVYLSPYSCSVVPVLWWLEIRKTFTHYYRCKSHPGRQLWWSETLKLNKGKCHILVTKKLHVGQFVFNWWKSVQLNKEDFNVV